MPARRASACTRPVGARRRSRAAIDDTLLEADEEHVPTSEARPGGGSSSSPPSASTRCGSRSPLSLARHWCRRLFGGRVSSRGDHRRRKNFETRRRLRRRCRDRYGDQRRRAQSAIRRTVERDIEAVVDPCRQCATTSSKVIIEAGLLTDEEKLLASTPTKAAGADFVKTSTGFGPGGATVADVALMRLVVGAELGVKAAGGVRISRA